MLRWCSLALVGLVGCYRPTAEASCALTCEIQNASNDCPGELSCNAQGRCSLQGATCAPDSGIPDGPGPNPDGPMPDDPPGLFCFGTSPMRPCFESNPIAALPISSGFSTTSCPLGDVMVLDGRPHCVVVARDVTISGAPHITGDKPLVIVGSFSIQVASNAVLDLSSSTIINLRTGAGAHPSECQTPPSPINNQDGAAGGSFAGQGGNGGVGQGGSAPGTAAPVSAIAVRGGCNGSAGPNGNPGGLGGGAVYLISNAIQVDGVVRATGGGGVEGDNSGGGAGGGTGGYIGIDAATVLFGNNGRLVASGGGGGGGGCMGEGGGNGIDADTTSNISALGGAGVGGQGGGGTGGSVLNQRANSGADTDGMNCAGGGGGGGVGTIQFFRTTQTCVSRCFPSAVVTP